MPHFAGESARMIPLLESPSMMPRIRLCALSAVFAFAFGSAAQAQSPAADESRVVLENEQVRVIEMRFKPGAKFDIPGHPNRFIYGLSDGALLFSPPGKTPYELSFRSGEALWLPAESMAPRK